MKKKEYTYDYKFDWILRKARVKEITPDKEDYKKKLKEKLDEREGNKKRKRQDDDEEEEAKQY